MTVFRAANVVLYFIASQFTDLLGRQNKASSSDIDRLEVIIRSPTSYQTELKLQDTKMFVAPILLVDFHKLGKYTLVQREAHCIVLLNRSIEETLHHTMITNTLDDVSL